MSHTYLSSHTATSHNVSSHHHIRCLLYLYIGKTNPHLPNIEQMTAFLPSFLPSFTHEVCRDSRTRAACSLNHHPPPPRLAGWLAAGPQLSPLITSPGLFLQCNLSININPIQCTPNNRKCTHCNPHACYISKLLWLTVRELCMQPVCVCVCVCVCTLRDLPRVQVFPSHMNRLLMAFLGTTSCHALFSHQYAEAGITNVSE